MQKKSLDNREDGNCKVEYACVSPGSRKEFRYILMATSKDRPASQSQSLDKRGAKRENGNCKRECAFALPLQGALGGVQVRPDGHIEG